MNTVIYDYKIFIDGSNRVHTTRDSGIGVNALQHMSLVDEDTNNIHNFKSCYALSTIIDGVGTKNSNNLSEYMSMVGALDWMLSKNLHGKNVMILTDSQLVANQLKGFSRVKNKEASYYQGYDYAKIRLNLLKAKMSNRIHIKWVPREENIADSLTRKYKRIKCFVGCIRSKSV